MAESKDERWSVDIARDTSMQTRLIPLSDLEDEGLDIDDEPAQSGSTEPNSKSTPAEPAAPIAHDPSPAPPQPLPPSFFPTNTGRMRPVIDAASSAASGAAARTDMAIAPRTNGTSPQTAPFGSIGMRNTRANRRAASAYGGISSTNNTPGLSTGKPQTSSTNAAAANESSEPSEPSPSATHEPHAPRKSYSLQYRALHPHD